MKFLFPEDERVKMRRASLETFCIVDYFNRGKILNEKLEDKNPKLFDVH